jgi:hypothetical protein
MRRRGRTGEVAEDVAGDVVGVHDVVLDESETGMLKEHVGVRAAPGMVVIEADDLMSVVQEAEAKVRS